jgi:hypothetical protein
MYTHYACMALVGAFAFLYASGAYHRLYKPPYNRYWTVRAFSMFLLALVTVLILLCLLLPTPWRFIPGL